MIRKLIVTCGCLISGFALAQSGGSARLVDNTADLAEEMRVAATALLESVRGAPEFSERLRGYSMEDELLLTFDDAERRDWVYWPAERAGLSFDLMHAKHRALTHDLLWTLASPKGYHKLVNIMTLETVLQATSGTGFPRGIEDYTLTLFGEPDQARPWSWRLEGHHISLTITVVPGAGVSVTPTFLGADPAEVTFGPLAGLRVLRIEEDLARELIRSMSDDQRGAATLPGMPEYNAAQGYTYDYDTPWDLIASNILKDPAEWENWRTDLEPDGIAFAAMNGAQQAMLLELLDEIFATYRPVIADSYRATLDLDSLHFAWIGGLERGEPHYYRIQTDDLLFEYDNAQSGGNHVHAVWHSRAGNFGDDLLAEHYQQAH